MTSSVVGGELLELAMKTVKEHAQSVAPLSYNVEQMKMLVRIYTNKSFKSLLYVVLVILVILSAAYWGLSAQSSLSENLLAGSIEILITVTIIDGLISADRRRRMRLVNEQNAASVKIMVGLKIVRLINAFGAKAGATEMDLVSDSNANMRMAVDEFMASKDYVTFLAKLEKMEGSLRTKIKKLSELMQGEISDLNKLLEEAKPYPDPSLTAKVAEFQPKMIAKFSIINFMYDVIYEHLPSKGHEDVKKDKGFWPFFQRMYRDLAVNNKGSDRSELISFEGMVNETFDLLLEVRQRAEDNNLHYDV